MSLSKMFWHTVMCGWGIAAIGVWVWVTGYGFSAHERPKNPAHDRWPGETSLSLSDDRLTLVLFMHPRCPCTRATLRELEKLLTGQGLDSGQLPSLIVLATIPSDSSEQSEEWRESETIRMVAQLPHSVVVWDVDGTETACFGAVSSGMVMLYDSSGARRFAGGVTASRGHEGDNAGSDSVLAALTRREWSGRVSTPAFGCRLCLANTNTDSLAVPKFDHGPDTNVNRGEPR